MIQEANVGVGIYGKEGMRAAQSADYALPEFKALWRMLMCHGRWSYIRNSEMILYFFYKNMVFSMPLMIWNFFNGFSSQTVYDDYYMAPSNQTPSDLIVKLGYFKNLFYYTITHIFEISKKKFFVYVFVEV